MNNIKNSFTIHDLEILTGIKAHTIRIWEKRYNLLNPTRLNRNIRMYNLSDLQRILNISTLYKNNYKISKLSKFTDSQLAEEAKTIELNDFTNTYEINSLIISMYTFDEELFQEIYNTQIKKISFSEIYVHTYVPLLNYIGILWQTESIKPAQEHFISKLIYQKIVYNTSTIKTKKTSDKNVYILFLPEGEIHELGLLYLNYLLKLHGKKIVYLGDNIPFDNLFYVNSQFKEITWISYFLIERTIEEKNTFLNKINDLLSHTSNKCYIVGDIWKDFSIQVPNSNIILKDRLESLASAIQII